VSTHYIFKLQPHQWCIAPDFTSLMLVITKTKNPAISHDSSTKLCNA